MPDTYIEELDKDTGEMVTKVSGLAKAKKAESRLQQPQPVPE